MIRIHKYPVFNENVMIHQCPEEGRIYVPGIKGSPKAIMSYNLNKDAQRIFTRFDGTSTLDQVIEELTDDQDKHLASIPAVLEFIDNIQKACGFNFIEFHPEPQKAPINITGSPTRFIPSHASVELTDRCNLNCSYCYRNSDSKKVTYLENPVEFFAGLFDVGIRHIELTGGEPLMHPKILEILEYLQKFYLVAIITNGTLINEGVLDFLKNKGNGFFVQIGLDGSTAKAVDTTAGIPGAFKKITKAINDVAKTGIRLRVAMIVDTVDKFNDIENTLLLAKELGADWFTFSLPYEEGRARTLGLNPSLEQLTFYYSLIPELEKKYYGFFIPNPGGVLDHLSKSHHCGSGYRTITISPDKQVRLCPLAVEKLDVLGRIKEEPLKDILINSPLEIFYYSKAPHEAVCGDCLWIINCKDCFYRGFKKAREIGYSNCRWAQGEGMEVVNFLKTKMGN